MTGTRSFHRCVCGAFAICSEFCTTEASSGVPWKDNSNGIAILGSHEACVELVCRRCRASMTDHECYSIPRSDFGIEARSTLAPTKKKIKNGILIARHRSTVIFRSKGTRGTSGKRSNRKNRSSNLAVATSRLADGNCASSCTNDNLPARPELADGGKTPETLGKSWNATR